MFEGNKGKRPKMNKNYVILSKISKKLLIGSFAFSVFALHSCNDNKNSSVENFTEETIKESTKGIVTELEEIPPGDDYKILDEKIIEDKQKSIAIVHRLTGKTDTVKLAQLKDEKNVSNHNGLRNVLLFGLAASFFNRNLSRTSPNSSVYKNADTYNKSAGLQNNLNSSAASRTVRTPGRSTSGYGSGKSFRSHGG